MKFGLSLKKKVSVNDIKQYLVDEFENTKSLQNQVYDLQDKIKKCAETQLKYDTTLLTLDEYKKRLEEKDRRIRSLDRDIEDYERRIKNINSAKNDEILKYKKLEKMYDELKSNFDSKLEKELKNKTLSYRKVVIEKVKNLKGRISKQQIIDLLKEV